MSNSRSHGKRISTGKMVAIVIVCIVLLVAGIAAFLLTHYAGLLGDLRQEEIGKTYTDANTNESDQITATSDISKDVFTILLIGVDSRYDTYTGRSDTQVMISINQKQKKLVIASLLRDCYVSIPGHGNNRINAAYAEGGTSLLTQTIKNNFGIPIDRVAVVNFKTVADFIDAIGGVDIDVSEEEIQHINNSGSGYISGAGVNHLNGSQAVAYARIRKVDSDFGRTKRQRVVIEDALDKVGDMSLTKQSSLLQEFLPRVHTDLKMSEVINLGSLMLRLKSFNVASFAIPIDGSWRDMTVRGMAVLDVDFAANKKAWEDAVS